MEDLDHHLYIYHMILLAQPSSQPKRHLDRFSRFAGLTIVTDRQTEHVTPSVTTGRIDVVQSCGLKIGEPNKTHSTKKYVKSVDCCNVTRTR